MAVETWLSDGLIVRTLVVETWSWGERLGCRNSVMRDLFVTDLVARSSVVKSSVVKGSVVKES